MVDGSMVGGWALEQQRQPLQTSRTADDQPCGAPSPNAIGALAAAAAALLTASGSSKAAGSPQEGERVNGREQVVTPDSHTKGNYCSLRLKVGTRVESTKLATAELEDSLAKVKQEYRSHMSLLRELDRERIDLQASAHWLASTRDNWRHQHNAEGLVPSVDLDRRLAEEESVTLAEVREVQSHIAMVSRQTTRLREAGDALEQQLGEHRLRKEQESDLLKHCKGSLHALDKRLERRAAAKKAGKPLTSQPWRHSWDHDFLTHPRTQFPGRKHADLFANARLNDGRARGDGSWSAR